jgi:hypothetical protein
MSFSVQVPELRRQWSVLMNEELGGLPKEALIASIKDLASELLDRTKNSEENSSNLVDHAKQELELIGEEPETIEGYLKVIQAFADMGHSGGSASVAIPTIKELLNFHNLSPLTDDPDEWICHEKGVWDGKTGVWQSSRNPEAFSKDGGKTYYLLSEGGRDNQNNLMRKAAKSKVKE